MPYSSYIKTYISGYLINVYEQSDSRTLFALSIHLLTRLTNNIIEICMTLP